MKIFRAFWSSFGSFVHMLTQLQYPNIDVCIDDVISTSVFIHWPFKP